MVKTYAGTYKAPQPGWLSLRLPTGGQRELRHRNLIHRHTVECQLPRHTNNVVRRPSKLLQTPSSTLGGSLREARALCRHHYNHRYLSIRSRSVTHVAKMIHGQLTSSIEHIILRITERVEARELKSVIDVVDLCRRILGRWRRVIEVEMQDCKPIEESALLYFKDGVRSHETWLERTFEVSAPRIMSCGSRLGRNWKVMTRRTTYARA